jgi:hypothetical protein
MPGESPPEVRTAIFFISFSSVDVLVIQVS